MRGVIAKNLTFFHWKVLFKRRIYDCLWVLSENSNFAALLLSIVEQKIPSVSWLALITSLTPSSSLGSTWPLLSSSRFVFELLLEVLSNYRDRHSKRKNPKTEFLINSNMIIRGKPKILLYIPYTRNRNSQKYLIKRLKF